MALMEPSADAKSKIGSAYAMAHSARSREKSCWLYDARYHDTVDSANFQPHTFMTKIQPAESLRLCIH